MFQAAASDFGAPGSSAREPSWDVEVCGTALMTSWWIWSLRMFQGNHGCPVRKTEAPSSPNESRKKQRKKQDGWRWRERWQMCPGALTKPEPHLQQSLWGVASSVLADRYASKPTQYAYLSATLSAFLYCTWSFYLSFLSYRLDFGASLVCGMQLPRCFEIFQDVSISKGLRSQPRALRWGRTSPKPWIQLPLSDASPGMFSDVFRLWFRELVGTVTVWPFTSYRYS